MLQGTSEIRHVDQWGKSFRVWDAVVGVIFRLVGYPIHTSHHRDQKVSGLEDWG